ncbi:MAG: enoyl-CoA hydratase/isomerase family protein [Candidatus Lokiarchaeota archaeon]|jgi:enoyl-CoA hydratase|nr:enoyl-CoA hydratase/isomerase family protein [Candidatus Lokiarchaeota archaeon]
MDFETIEFELDEKGIGIVTLNRPERLNALSFQMIKDLHQLLDHLMINLDCRVVILKANGKAFCAGLDLKESTILQQKKKPPELKEKFFFMNAPEKDIIKAKIYAQMYTSQIIIKMRKISQPIITLINGAASGAGFALALASDVRIASEKARLNNAFIKVGFSGADLGVSYFLPRLIGMSRAAEILYTGRFIDANESKQIGIVSKVCSESELLDEALKIAENFLEKSPLGLRMTKQAINATMDSPSLDTIAQIENITQMLCSTSSDIMEGIQSFFDKRKPNYPLM